VQRKIECLLTYCLHGDGRTRRMPNAEETLTSLTFYTFPVLASPILHNFVNLRQPANIAKL